MDSDPKKQDSFKRGLNYKLKDRLALARPNSYNDLVNMAIVQENAIAAHRADKKRKAPMAQSSAPPPKFRLVSSPQRQILTSFWQN